MKKNIYIIIMLFISLGLNAQTQNKLFEEGNKQFKNKEYELALKSYLSIEKQNIFSSELYYNIGNTYFRLNDYTNSILYYERGLKLDPNNEDLNTNLKIAKARLKSDIYIIPNFFLVRWWNNIINLFTPYGWAIVSITLLLITCILFIFYYFSFDKKVLLFYALILSILILITSCFAGYTRQNELNSKNQAIVFGEQTIGKDSPDKNSSDKMKILKGQKIKIVDKEDSWIRVKTEDGKEAWIESKDVVLI